MIEALRYCTHCKEHIKEEESVLFVDETYHRGFCSEKCIENYFNPIITQFNKMEMEIRKKLNVEAEPCLALLNESLPENVLTMPDELFEFPSESYETLYALISKKVNEEHGKVFYLGLGLIMQGQFSFLFFITCTQNQKFLDYLRKGKKVENIGEILSAEDLGELSELNDEDLGAVELKKSAFLAKLMDERMPSDIPFEEFPVYDEFLQKTIEQPDEIFESKDEDGDELQTFVKAFEKEGRSFFYLAFCLIKEKDEDEYMVVPFMSFPTVDPELYKKYCQGNKVSGSLKN